MHDTDTILFTILITEGNGTTEKHYKKSGEKIQLKKLQTRQTGSRMYKQFKKTIKMYQTNGTYFFAHFISQYLICPSGCKITGVLDAMSLCR